MAFPSSFDESDEILSAPPGMESRVEPLSVLRTIDGDGKTPSVISCWKLTKEELDEVNRTGRIWVGVAGITMPHIWISGQNPFIIRTNQEEE